MKNSKQRRKIPPNLFPALFIAFIFIILMAFSVVKATSGNLNIYFYYIVIWISFLVLFIIKVKYMILDVLGIKKWKYVDESTTREEVKV